MRIVISGQPGSGKSTAAKAIAKKLGLKHYSMGDFQREIAKEKGISLIELSKLEEKDDSIDRMVDKKQTDLGNDEDDFILDSRLSAKFIPHADFRIFIKCDLDERAKRISLAKREDEKGSFEDIKKGIIERESSERNRFKKYYGFDYQDERHYNVVIDSTDISKDEVIDMVLSKIRK